MTAVHRSVAISRGQWVFFNAQSFDAEPVENFSLRLIISTKQVMTLPCFSVSGYTEKITS